MKTPWPVVALAVGLAFLFAAISLVFGAAAASAVVGGAGVAYAALNVLLGKKKDDVTASQVLQRVFSVSKITYAAAVAIWLGALGVVAVPIGDRLFGDRFTIRIVDETRQPVDGARVDIGFGSDWAPVPLERGVGVVRYYPRFTSSPATVRVRYAGVDRSITHQLNEHGRFDDLVVPVWSGQARVSVGHFTATGMAIEAFLRGELPADLRARFPRIRVMRNQVFETAQEVLRIYNREDWLPTLDYTRTDSGGSAPPRRTSRTMSVTGPNDPQLRAYLGRGRNAALVEPILAAIGMDFTHDVLGAPAGEPLPRGFLARVNGPEYWSLGAEAIPEPAADAPIRAIGSTARAPNGAVRMQLERLMGSGEIAQLLARGSAPGASGIRDEEAQRYLRYMLRHNAPPGLIQGVVYLDATESCDFEFPQVQLLLPEPALRVTLLKNTGSTALNLSEIILSMQMRDGIARASAPARMQEIRLPFDQLEPGDAVLIPRELFFRSPYSDEELAAFGRPVSRDIVRFRLIPRMHTAEAAVEFPAPDGFYHRPRAMALSMAQLRASDEPYLGEASEDPQSDAHAARHPAYVVGPSVGEIDYVVNGARIRARSDLHITIAMVGSVGEGSCPFVFARYRGRATPVNLGQVIRRRVGSSARGRDRVRIPSGVRQLEIRELEDEVSYLDAAWLIVRSGRRERRYPARNLHLGSEDGSFAILHRGDRAVLSFGRVPQPAGSEISLEVSGYYELVRRRGAAHVGHRRR